MKRYATEPVLEAVADRTQITSVLTEAGEMLTQASFMVKNNEKQFQRFQLPKDARLWGCYVNGQPAKPERDNDWVLVPLPRDVDRDQAFAVDIVYAQTNGALAAHWSKTLELNAPRTDVPNTYAEWQLVRAAIVPAFPFRRQHEHRAGHHLRTARRVVENSSRFTSKSCAKPAGRFCSSGCWRFLSSRWWFQRSGAAGTASSFCWSW